MPRLTTSLIELMVVYFVTITSRISFGSLSERTQAESILSFTIFILSAIFTITRKPQLSNQLQLINLHLSLPAKKVSKNISHCNFNLPRKLAVSI